MDNKFSFTKKRIDSLPTPVKGKRVQYHDDKTSGLILRITDTGNKSFQVYKKINGKPIRVTLGKYPSMTIEQARKLAMQKLAELADGINPNLKKKADKVKGITLIECFDDYLRTKTKLKPGTVHDYKRVMRAGFGDWQDKPLKEITRDMVATKHRALGKHSHARANNSMRVLRALFNFAAEVYEDEEGRTLFPDNPVRRLSKTTAWYNVERKQTIIKEHELSSWFEAVQDLSGSDKHIIARDYFQVLLLTGMRKTECATLLWDNVDFQQKTLKIVDTKNSKPHTLPLSDYLYDLLKAAHSRRTQDKYVFPSTSTDSGYVSDSRRFVAIVVKQSGITFALHDLRRTFITIAEGRDIPVYALKRLVNHSTKNSDVTDGYIITDVERLRKPMQQITDYILKTAGVKEPTQVIQLKEAS